MERVRIDDEHTLVVARLSSPSEIELTMVREGETFGVIAFPADAKVVAAICGAILRQL